VAADALALLAAAAWAGLLSWRGRYWSTAVGLPPPAGSPRGPEGEEPAPWPSLGVVVPARNEAGLLPATLPRLLSQEYPGRAHVVVVDDSSTDGTADVARQVARRARPGRDLSLSVVEGRARPAGWAGKPWAMAQGVEHLRRYFGPQWLLFTDADIAHPPGSFRQLVGSARASGRSAVSLMANLYDPATAPTACERLLLAAFVYFFAQLYPFHWVNDPTRRTAAAAGGCLLVEAEALSRAGGIEAIAGNTIDDIALAKALKRSRANIWLGLAGAGRPPGQAPAVLSLRRYRGLQGVWEMVARNAYTQLRHNPALLVATAASMGVAYVSPPLLALGGLASRRPLASAAGFAAWAAMAATFAPMARHYRAPVVAGPSLPAVAALYTAMTISSAWRHYHRRATADGLPPTG